MNYADVSGLSERELKKKVKDLRQDIFEANMKNAMGQLANPMTIRQMRRDVARLQTALTAKSHGAAETSASKVAKPARKSRSAAKKPKAAKAKA